ncbi:MAG: extracellular solute-binding protein, partial [Lachnospiraceae bacterium]|nr:extracellular solute-binding protein [Lachnospiraceae bacterium]
MTASLLAGCGGSTGNTENTQTPAADNTAGQTEQEAPKQEEAKEDAETPAVEEQVLRVAAFEGGYGADMWTEVAAAFEASHPGVTVELTVDKKIEDVISPSMKAGDYPDVVHLATGREAALTETLTKENALLPLTDVLEMTVPGEDVKVKDKIVPGFLDTLATNPYGDGVTYYA